jgi:hypothetical protein
MNLERIYEHSHMLFVESTPTRETGGGHLEGLVAEKVRILPSISGRFVRAHRLRPDSAKTYGNPVRRTTCQKTDEFPVAVTAALVGR